MASPASASSQLLRDAGIKVHERSIRWSEFLEADEVFSTGNYAKVAPITRVEHKSLQPGPIMQKARDLYWDYALAAATADGARHGLSTKGVPSKASAPRPIFSIALTMRPSRPSTSSASETMSRFGVAEGEACAQFAGQFLFIGLGPEHAERGIGRRRRAADAGPAMDQHRVLRGPSSRRSAISFSASAARGGVWPSICCTMSWK